MAVAQFNSDIRSVVLNLIAGGIEVFIGVLLIYFRKQWQRRRRAFRPLLLGSMSLVYVGANVIHYYRPVMPSPIFLVVTSAVLGLVVWRELYQFWRIGLVGADKSISSGVDFKRSLELCTNSLDFLGISGNKLTSTKPTFDEAIARCNRDTRPIRFLLCNPKSPELLRIAKRAHKPEAEYQNTARKSLRILADLRNERERNIEVRFYETLPLFRLMFIDDSLCLASHYVFGEGDGGQLPQLHVRKPTAEQRDVETLYHPFRKYFDLMWEAATPWDFKSQLNNS